MRRRPGGKRKDLPLLVALVLLAERKGLLGPSMGLTPSRCALRGQPAAVRIRSRRVRRPWVLTRHRPPETRNAPFGAFLVSGGEGGIVRPIHGPHPCALCAPGPACGCPNSLRANSSSQVGSYPASPSETRNAPDGAFLVSGGEGGIRTLGTLARTPDFESGTFDHSATSPVGCESARAGKCTRWPVARQAWPPRVPAGVVCFQPAFFLASRSHVSTTVSGFRDNDSMPCSISHSARSG